ncbi:MAG: porin [Marinobacter sp.]|nr:porin [Marinobacter sp.]
MKKTLIASAVAAATFSVGALAGAHDHKNLPTVYGNIQLAIAHDNVDGGNSQLDHFDNGSTIGFKHEHLIAPGITGFFKAEFHFDADKNKNADDERGGIFEIDEAYIGIKGENFGTIWVGADDSTYLEFVDKIAQFYEVATLNMSVAYDTGEDNLVQYLSPVFDGFQFGVAVEVDGSGDRRANSNGRNNYPFQLAARYTMDNLELAFAMDSNDGKRDSINNKNTYGLAVTYTLDNLTMIGEFQTREDVADKYGIMGVYTLGPNQFALSYEYYEADNGTKSDTVTLQALHNVSSNLYVFFEGYLGGGDSGVYGNDFAVDRDGSIAGGSDERAIAAIGAVYHF